MAADVPWLDELRLQVRARLRAQRATQKGLAAHLGISEKHVNQLLTGKVLGSPDMIGRLASAVGLRVTIVDSGETPPNLAGHKRKIDRWFPRLGACGICGVPGMDQRHRVIEAIADRVNAGEGEEDVADDYDVPVQAVRECVRWSREHPDGTEVNPPAP